MSITITSFFTNSGLPQSGLAPTIRIWQVDGANQTLIVGAPNGTGQNTDGTMSEVDDGTSTDGFYQFEFTTALGYVPTNQYICRVDGGPTILNATERYQSSVANPADCLETVVDAVWDEPAIDHVTAGSTGEQLNQVHAGMSSLMMGLVDVQQLIDILLKYETNRTRIDHNANTLTVYDDDCTTELRVFQLLDHNGNPSTDDVCERVPVSATDGLPVCP